MANYLTNSTIEDLQRYIKEIPLTKDPCELCLIKAACTDKCREYFEHMHCIKAIMMIKKEIDHRLKMKKILEENYVPKIKFNRT
jgi:hypothetical protein